MEIWPPGHSSPVHDHGKSSAVIKVLHGQIQCTWYNSLHGDKGQPEKIGNPVIMKKADVTWLGEEQYQIHKLHNPSRGVCVTLQCYRFEEQDNVHDEYFHYLETGSDNEKKFDPNSDMAFTEFYKTMLHEWTAPEPNFPFSEAAFRSSGDREGADQ
jgi:predicted metal-dependent enzyme (double-stranded beta helix superfamily)